MNLTKEDLKAMKEDKAMRLLASLFGINFDKFIKDVEESSKEECPKEECSKPTTSEPRFVKTVSEPAVPAEDPNELLENSDEREWFRSLRGDEESNYESNFSMDCEELKTFIKDYTKLDSTFHKLEHTYGIDLNAGPNSIYAQSNKIIWDLIGNIFGSDNRDDIADYIFGDSNFDTVEDLYEELI